MDQFLPKFRKEKGFNQGEMAKKLGISRQSVHALEHGLSKPSLDLIAKMEALFDASWRDFFPEMSQKHPWQTIKSLDGKEKIQNSSQSKINNFSDAGDYITLEIYLPGIKKEDIELEIGKTQLIVRVQRVEEESREEENHSYFHQVASSSMQRTFSLPEEIDQEKTDAKFENEVLKLKLYKLSPKVGNKTIHFE
jgi:HSP20 family protein